MPKIVLPDGSSREYPAGVSLAEVADDLGPRWQREALAAEIDGRVVGLDYRLAEDGEHRLRLLSRKDSEALGVMRHSCAHIMARAVMRLYPGVGLAFGPTIENGFYYDFDLEQPLSEEDFPKIEAEMARIIEADEPFERIETPRDQALEICRDLNQPLKVEHIQEGLADHASLSFYRQGEFVDLCRGPHVRSPKAIGAFKLLSVAGAYWKGDETRQQLQRLYGTAWFHRKDLDEYLHRVEEAKRRDHRVLGRKLELFSVSQTVGPGLVLWLPKGAKVRSELEQFIRGELLRRHYEPVYTPQIGRVDLYETSGHYPYYAESQFPPMVDHPVGRAIEQFLRAHRQGKVSRDRIIAYVEEHLGEDVPPALRPEIPGYQRLKDPDEKLRAIERWFGERERYLLRPMNCPHHVMIYKSKPRSYRDLPVRLAEFGTVYRHEKSGELGGMTRVRGFTQDDAHLFCTEDQVADEFRGCLEMTMFVLTTLGLEYRVRLSFRDPKSDKYVGRPEVWDRAESELEAVCRSMDLPGMDIAVGEAAFYGPKADFLVADCLGREWQLGTVQLDYNLPSEDRFALEYVGPDNQPHRPVMIHRAPLGSMERFVGMLIEHFAGAFPLWLAPEQVRVMVVSQKFEEYGRQVEGRLRAAGLRVSGDYRPEKIGAKIRDAQLELVPYMLICGGREMEQGTVAVRDRLEGDLGPMSLEALIGKLRDEVAGRTLRKSAERFVTAGLGDRGKAAEY